MKQISEGAQFREENIFEFSTIHIYNYCVDGMIIDKVGVFYHDMLFNNNNDSHLIIIRSL